MMFLKSHSILKPKGFILGGGVTGNWQKKQRYVVLADVSSGWRLETLVGRGGRYGPVPIRVPALA